MSEDLSSRILEATNPEPLNSEQTEQQSRMFQDRQLRSGVGLCLSGGGYRAMLFHLGSLLRLCESGVLSQVAIISSVSGGSITAGALAVAWNDLKAAGFSRDSFMDTVVRRTRRLASRTIDVRNIVLGPLIPWRSVADMVAGSYDKHLFDGFKLQELPSQPGDPFFVFCSTNLQTGALFRFTRGYMADYLLGMWLEPDLRLAVAVAASSAFPPVLSPLVLKLPGPPERPAIAPAFASLPARAVLSDGGVYDNLGLEPVFKSYQTVLVSDGGGKIAPNASPPRDWAFQSKRVLDVIDNQVRSVRKRQLIGAYEAVGTSVHRFGAYWGIRSHVADYRAGDPLGYIGRDQQTQLLAQIPTRLAAMREDRQEALINWGYVICDAALRAHFGPAQQAQPPIAIGPSAGLPYPDC